MAQLFNILFFTLWLAWMVYWWTMARRVKDNARRESVRSRRSYSGLLMLAFLLLALPDMQIPFLERRFLPEMSWPLWPTLGAILVAAGLLFTVWARAHLGRNWSDIVTIKIDHELIMTGPYQVVRHPIYTGLLLAFIGQAIAGGEWRGLIGVAIGLWAFLLKSRVEERLMREQFGPAYQAYSQRIASIIPFIL